MTARRIHRQKWKDPFVPIRGERLRAAMELADLTPTSLARALSRRLGARQNPQTLDHLSRGEGFKRCRASRRHAVASLLDVPEEWLAGEAYALPFPAALQLAAELEGSARLTLATGRFLHRAYHAVVRDLKRESGNRPLRAAGAGDEGSDVLAFMLAALASQVSPVRAQQALLSPANNSTAITKEAVTNAERRLLESLVRWGRTIRLEEWTQPGLGPPIALDHEEAALGLVRAWTHVLLPWFDGQAVLNYRRFLDLAAVHSPAVLQQYPQSWHERPSVEQLPIAPPTSPYAVIDWPLEQAHQPRAQHQAGAKRASEGRKSS